MPFAETSRLSSTDSKIVSARCKPVGIALCASCDRCRARKTKCDGKRPCGYCAANYLKNNGISTLDEVFFNEVGCIYSPAKRRGPVPRKAGKVTMRPNLEQTKHHTPHEKSIKQQRNDPPQPAGNVADNEENFLQQNLESKNIQVDAVSSSSDTNGKSLHLQRQLLIQEAQAMQSISPTHHTPQEKIIKHPRNDPSQPVVNDTADKVNFLQRHLNSQKNQLDAVSSSSGINEMSLHIQRQLLIQEAQAMQSIFPTGPFRRGTGATGVGEAPVGDPGNFPRQQVANQQRLDYLTQLQAHHQQFNSVIAENPKSSRKKQVFRDDAIQKDRISKLLYLLDSSCQQGVLLKGYYNLSINELFNLPRIQSEEEYCLKNVVKSIPVFDRSALQAAHFSELALGALISGDVQLSLALSNAAVIKLRECVEEPVSASCILDVAQAYFLHGIYRGYHGDFEKYFKYRRVCLTHLSELDNIVGIECLLSAMSFHDTLMYMMYGGEEEKLPDINDVIPPICKQNGLPEVVSSLIVSDPNNQMWVQGAPMVFLNKKAPLLSRSLDALACSIRSCCDMAGKRSEMMQNEHLISATAKAVMHNEDELCSRNMVISAFSLLKVHESSPIDQSPPIKNKTHHLIISAMDAFLENGNDCGKESPDQNEPSGFSDSQVQSLLSVCNTIVEFPLILFSGGPVYHMVSNVAILLCHFLNDMAESASVGITTVKRGETPDEVDRTTQNMQKAFFEEVLDTFLAVRKLLNIHRRKLPNKLRCHSIPRPILQCLSRNHNCADKLIDLGDTIMCSCRGCQGFVLMPCSPCVAAERMMNAEQDEKLRNQILEKEGVASVDEFDMDDDMLLNVLSRIIKTV